MNSSRQDKAFYSFSQDPTISTSSKNNQYDAHGDGYASQSHDYKAYDYGFDAGNLYSGTGAVSGSSSYRFNYSGEAIGADKEISSSLNNSPEYLGKYESKHQDYDVAPVYSYESKQEYREYNDGVLSSGYKVTEVENSTSGYHRTSQDLVSGNTRT